MIWLCQLEIHVLFMFKETTIQWMYLKSSCKERPFFGFDKNHTILLKDKSLQFYMVMFSIFLLYMCMYLIWEKAVSKYQHLGAFGIWVFQTQNCKHWRLDCGQNNENTCIIVVMLDCLLSTTSTYIGTLAHITPSKPFVHWDHSCVELVLSLSNQSNKN